MDTDRIEESIAETREAERPPSELVAQPGSVNSHSFLDLISNCKQSASLESS